MTDFCLCFSILIISHLILYLFILFPILNVTFGLAVPHFFFLLYLPLLVHTL